MSRFGLHDLQNPIQWLDEVGGQLHESRVGDTSMGIMAGRAGITGIYDVQLVILESITLHNALFLVALEAQFIFRRSGIGEFAVTGFENMRIV